MKLTFVGGVDRVGSLGMLVESGGKRTLFDYGLTPSKPPKYPSKVPATDDLFITHSHMDHIGMAPWLCGEYGTTVWGTELTLEISLVLLEDSLKISGLEGYTTPYDLTDLRRYSEEFEYIRFNETIEAGPFSISTMRAGHIPGSTMYRIDDGGPEIVFTGDINTATTRLQNPVKPPKCDVLVMESTYSGRSHPSRKSVEEAFLTKVEEVLDRGGQVIIPVFGVGRSQEIADVLSSLQEEKWLDGMGRRVAQIYLRHPEFLRDARHLRRSINKMNFVRTPHQRKKAMRAPVIVTTSGMLEGGPVLGYLDGIGKDSNSAILLTGYQAEDTNGRMLLETGSLEIGGSIEKMNCEVCQFDFSAHAGHDGLVEFARSTGAENVVLVHGDERKLLASDISEFATVHLPMEGDDLEF